MSLTRAAQRYQACYCEENIWWLCQAAARAGLTAHAVIVSSPWRAVRIWDQRSGREGEPVIWDYHVLLLTVGPWRIWDLDTRLPFPCPAPDYLGRAFRDADVQPAGAQPLFRLLDGGTYTRALSTDRSHMRGPDGRFTRPPPPWPPPGSGPPNLMRLIDMTDPICGEVLDLATLTDRVSDAAATG